MRLDCTTWPMEFEWDDNEHMRVVCMIKIIRNSDISQSSGMTSSNDISIFRW